MKNRQRFRIRIVETYEDCVWIEADSWEEAEREAMILSDFHLTMETISDRETVWTGDTVEIK